MANKIIQLLFFVTLLVPLITSAPKNARDFNSTNSDKELHRIARSLQFNSSSSSSGEELHRIARSALKNKKDDDSSSSSSSSEEEVHRIKRSPHHDGTDHDHETDQDHEHPVLTATHDAAKKSTVAGDASKQRPARDTAKESENPTKTSKAEKPKSDVSVSVVRRDSSSADKESGKKVTLNSKPPGPILLQGLPIQTSVTDDKEKPKTKRDTYSSLGGSSTIPPHVLPHLDPTPPPGYKPKYRRDTTETGSDRPPLGGPLKLPTQFYTKTEDGRDAVVPIPARPAPPQPPKYKRETNEQKHVQLTKELTPAQIKPAESATTGAPSSKPKRETDKKDEEKKNVAPLTVTKNDKKEDDKKSSEEHKKND